MSARKSLLRGMSTTEQHDKQKTMLTNMRAKVRTRSGSVSQQSTASESPANSKVPARTTESNSSRTGERARKSFATPLPPNDKTSRELPGSQDEASMHSTSGTPVKRKKRYYKGSTYGLYLSKRKKRREIVKKVKESDGKTTDSATVCPEGEESSQSVMALSESDGEVEAESSDLSNDELDVTDAHENHQEQVIETDTIDVGVATNVIIDLSEESPVNEEQISQNGHANHLAKTPIKTVNEEVIKKDSASQLTASSIIDSVKIRGHRDSETCLPNPPISAASSVVSRAESKQSSKIESVSKPANDSTVKPAVVIPANNVTPAAIEDPNRKTLLRISTAGTVKSGDTHGTYLGVEQSKFVIVVCLL